MKNIRNRVAANKSLITALIAVVILYFFIYASMQQTLLSHNVYDSYTIQAQRWWQGEAALDRDYSWLELAYYNDGIYVSFPPFPSVPMFLLVPFFGGNTPSNLMATLYTVLSFIIIFLFCRRKGLPDYTSLFWAGFAVFGGNLLSISPFGGVWYQAQILSFLLSALSIYFITSNKESHWYIAMVCWAFAVGCRPFQIIYFPIFVYFIYKHLKQSKKSIYSIIKFMIAPALIGAAYAWYNYVRFDSIFEFGHNYLPEFTSSEYGQFNLRYILANLPNIFRLPYFEDGLLTFPKFNGFAFYIANPIFIIYFIKLIKGLRNRKNRPESSAIHIIILICAVIHIILLLAHKTLGGWQFGIRYFVDLIPFLFLSVSQEDLKIKSYEIILFVFGFMLNIYGMLWLMLEWA